MHDTNRECVNVVERSCELCRIGRHLPEDRVPIQGLAAGEEPDLEIVQRSRSSSRGEPSGRRATYIAVADKFGNWASVIQSVHQSFGCGVVVEGTGIVLNNRMSGFNLIPSHPNEIGPAKRPAHTLSPVLVLKGNRPVLALGTPGGLGQTQFLTQIFCNLFDLNMSLQESLEAPRWQSESEGRVELESRFTTDVSEFLRHEGFDVKIAGPWEFSHGGAEAISLHNNGKVLLGAAESETGGLRCWILMNSRQWIMFQNGTIVLWSRFRFLNVFRTAMIITCGTV